MHQSRGHHRLACDDFVDVAWTTCNDHEDVTSLARDDCMDIMCPAHDDCVDIMQRYTTIAWMSHSQYMTIALISCEACDDCVDVKCLSHDDCVNISWLACNNTVDNTWLYTMIMWMSGDPHMIIT